MNLKNTDKEKIRRRKCQTKGCPNKATAIFKTKYLCEECYYRLNPKLSRVFPYINYMRKI